MEFILGIICGILLSVVAVLSRNVPMGMPKNPFRNDQAKIVDIKDPIKTIDLE